MTVRCLGALTRAGTLLSCLFCCFSHHKIHSRPQANSSSMCKNTMSTSIMHSPATQALQECRQPIGASACLSSAKLDFNMNNLFEQTMALDSAAFAPFPTIAWSFDESDSESDMSSAKTTKQTTKSSKKFDDLFKCHRRAKRSKHSSRMVRSKAQINGLSCLAGSTSSLRSLQSFVRLTASS